MEGMLDGGNSQPRNERLPAQREWRAQPQVWTQQQRRGFIFPVLTVELRGLLGLLFACSGFF